MAVSEVTCPECGEVHIFIKPVAVGKRLRCPDCGADLVAGATPRALSPRSGRGWTSDTGLA